MGSGDGPAEASLRIEVVYSPAPRETESVVVVLKPGATLADAVEASGFSQRHAEVATLQQGIWGRVRPPQTQLSSGDRVEVYRPLRVDPKEARRLRYRQDGIRPKRKVAPRKIE